MPVDFTLPPKGNLPIVIAREKEAYRYWQQILRNFPKVERFGLGQRIDLAFLDVLELNFSASYLPLEEKSVALGEIISRLDILKFFVQTAFENKLIHTSKYVELSKKLDEIGRMLYGWRKGLLKKLSPDSR